MIKKVGKGMKDLIGYLGAITTFLFNILDYINEVVLLLIGIATLVHFVFRIKNEILKQKELKKKLNGR